jgi:hypothetical protein
VPAECQNRLVLDEQELVRDLPVATLRDELVLALPGDAVVHSAEPGDLE